MALPIDCTMASAKKNGVSPIVMMGGFGFAIKKAKRDAIQRDIKKCLACKSMLLGQLADLPYKLRIAATHTCGGSKIPTSGCDYLENFNAGGDQMTIQKYGFDCNTKSGAGTEKYNAQIEAEKQANIQQQNSLYTGLAFFLIMVIIAAVVIYLKSQPKNGK